MGFDLNSINNGMNKFANQMGDITQGAVQLGQSLNGLINALNGMPTDQYNPTSIVPSVDGKVPLRALFTENTMYMPNPLEYKFS